MELKTLYFNFDSPLQKRFLRSISRKRLAIEISALEELMVAVSQLIMRRNKPEQEYKFCTYQKLIEKQETKIAKQILENIGYGLGVTP